MHFLHETFEREGFLLPGAGDTYYYLVARTYLGRLRLFILLLIHHKEVTQQMCPPKCR